MYVAPMGNSSTQNQGDTSSAENAQSFSQEYESADGSGEDTKKKTKYQEKSEKANSETRNITEAMKSIAQSDPDLFSKIQKDGASGDGNALVEDELKAYKENLITKDQATQAVSGAQSLANKNGGGRINNKIRDEAKDVLGESVIKGGKTRGQVGIENFLSSFSLGGGLIKGLDNATADPKAADVLTASKSIVKAGMQGSLQDIANTDSKLADKILSDQKKKDGNALVEDIIQAKEEGAISSSEGLLMGSQLGYLGKGKINKDEEQKFTETFGQDTLYAGSTKGSKALKAAESTMSHFAEGIVSPITDSIGAAYQAGQGNAAAAKADIKGALEGLLSDASLALGPGEASMATLGAATRTAVGYGGFAMGTYSTERAGERQEASSPNSENS